MDILKNLKDFEAEHFVLVALCFLAMFSPGLLVLALYFPMQFMEMSSLKLVLSSFAIGLPLSVPHIIGAGFLLSATKYANEEKFKFVPVMGTLFGAFAATIISYGAITLAFLIEVNFKTFVLLLIVVEIFFCAWWRYEFQKMKIDKNTQKSQSTENAADVPST
jgi:hypothetical protein